jgi:hypothetical protein
VNRTRKEPAPHHQDWPSTENFSGHHTTDSDDHSLSDQPCRCRRCRRVLTSPLSVSLGAGPVCLRHIFEGELFTAMDSFADALVVAR